MFKIIACYDRCVCVCIVYVCVCREIVALLLNNLKETKLKIYKSVFVGAVVSSKLFKHKGTYIHTQVSESKQSRTQLSHAPCFAVAVCLAGFSCVAKKQHLSAIRKEPDNIL